MQEFFALNWWLVLPILFTLAGVAFGFWLEGFEGALIALGVSTICWAARLYGRYEHWCVLPLLLTIVQAWTAWRDKVDARVWYGLAWLYFVGWAVVLYGRLTS